jgi:ABC-type maltose transport system permease subunit
LCPLGKGGCNEKCNCCSLPYYGSCHGDRWGRIQGEEIAEGPVTIIPKDTTFGNFRGLFTEKDFLLWVWNSLIITFTTAIIGIIIARASALAIAFLFNFMNAWNDYMLARIMLQKREMLTWTLGLFRLQDQFQTEWGMYAAASLLITLPVGALFFYSSKWLVSGLTLGSVKG